MAWRAPDRAPRCSRPTAIRAATSSACGASSSICDRDGSSPLLGGGDCDDRDPRATPAPPTCRATASIRTATAPTRCRRRRRRAAARGDRLAAWRDRAEVRAVLDRTRGHERPADHRRRAARRHARARRGRSRRVPAPDHAARRVGVVHARARAGHRHRHRARHAADRPPRSVPADRRPRCPRRSAAPAGARRSALPVEVKRYVGETLLDARRRSRRGRSTPTGAAKDVGDHVSARDDDATRACARSTRPAARPAFVWLHYFDVHEHHQIEVPDDAARGRVRDRRRPKRHTLPRAAVRDRSRGRPRCAPSSQRAGSPTRRSSCSRAITASRSAKIRGSATPTARSTYAPLVRIPIAIRIPGVPGGTAHRSGHRSSTSRRRCSALLGAPTAMRPLDGLDLVPALLDAPRGAAPGDPRRS